MRSIKIAIVSVTLLALLAMTLQYLSALWPAKNVDPEILHHRLALIQYGALAVILICAALYARRSSSGFQRIRLFSLTAAIGALGIFAALGGNPEAKPHGETTGIATMTRYKFTEDWTTENTAIWSRVLGGFKNRPVRALEVGSFEGRSALWFLENILTEPSASITCIDIWVGPYEQLFDSNMRVYGRPEKIVKIKESSQMALRGLKPESFDFIYIDGSHVAKDVMLDAVLAWDLLKPGGYMIFDDYNWYGPRSWLVANLTPKLAIDSFMRVFGPYADIVDQDYQLIIRKKPNPDHVPLERFQPLRSVILGLQRLIA